MIRNNRFLLLLSLCLCFSLLAGCAPRQPQQASFSQLGTISELATLRCYYHNVARYTDGQNSLFQLGYKRLWIEYAGIVTVGINTRLVTASEPDENGVVKVTIPKAEILFIDFDENSIAEISDTTLFSSFSITERTNTFAYAQQDMETTAKANEMILYQGQNRAKKVIEQYIQNVGSAIGKTYTVEWVEVE